jgi:hypothetical protein
VVVPGARAIQLPDGVGYELGASLGVPAMTAHRAVFSGGSVAGRTVLVAGGAGSVGRFDESSPQGEVRRHHHASAGLLHALFTC